MSGYSLLRSKGTMGYQRWASIEIKDQEGACSQNGITTQKLWATIKWATGAEAKSRIAEIVWHETPKLFQDAWNWKY